MMKNVFNPLLLIPIAMMSLVFCSIAQSGDLRPGEIDSVEKQCRFMLRTLGSAQHSYLQYGNGKDFGSWWDLQLEGYIPSGMNRSDYIERYSISHFQARPAFYDREGVTADSYFNIIAVPTNPYSGLRTFAIDATSRDVYVWTGNDKWWDSSVEYLDLDDIHNWVPAGKESKFIESWEQDCIFMLRALGSSQLAYAENENPEGSYGTYESMVNTGFIMKGYSRNDLITNYSLAVFDVAKGPTGLRYSSFTIVAVPTMNNGQLRTFAIGEDQTPRVWTGPEGRLYWLIKKRAVDLRYSEYWQPLR